LAISCYRKKIVDGEVKRYVDPIFEIQSNINKYVAEILQEFEERISNHDSLNPNFYFLFEDKFRSSEEEEVKK